MEAVATELEPLPVPDPDDDPDDDPDELPEPVLVGLGLGDGPAKALIALVAAPLHPVKTITLVTNKIIVFISSIPNPLSANFP